MRAYLDPAREDEGWTLPDLEIFWADDLVNDDGEKLGAGFYYWFCFPGCLPDSDPFGPFESEESALAAARDLHGE